ncbi:FAD-dependent oxidoreductase [Casimicrobium huifangae]|uniref:FAD-dependent oxidoreductase n=1 Tax=Casimicrobium huifangae TaxID=2591109 RepID=UPI0012EB3F21|nr:FAD-dependent oxidoreductase [Casimicrobium huifangae]
MQVEHCDLLVAGSGAGGLSTAVVAAHLGLKVIVVEKDSQFGGTTAWSGGWMWVPRNPLAVAAGIVESIDAPLNYLRHELGDGCNEPLVRTFLENAPHMVTFFREQTALQFIDGNVIPDFHGNSPDAATGGRSVCAAPFDGRQLGEHIRHLKPPLRETAPWGMGIASGADIRHFFNAMRSWSSFAYVTRRVLRHWRDRLLHGCGMHLVNGNALVAALVRSALDRNVEIRLNTSLVRLVGGNQHVGGRVTGAIIHSPHGDVEVRATRGVVLACGGFPHDIARKQQLLPHAPSGREHWSAAAGSCTGEGLRAGEEVGGSVSRNQASPAALAPVSLVPRPDGSLGHYPHLLERAKPGLISVTRDGVRFTNEANSYYDFMTDLLRVCDGKPTVEAWLVCDHAFIRHWGLGAAKPAPLPLRPYLRSGYLKRGRTLAALATECGINASALTATVARYNSQTAAGVDADFHKGETAYNRIQGDAKHGGPNPCMAPITQAPFYAVRVVPGSLGTFAGLVTDNNAQVLDSSGMPIGGLYACGNDMNSIMGGRYPSGGITLGPAMTFGYLAARHAAALPPH